MSDTEDDGLPPIAERRPHPRRKVLFGGTAVSQIRQNGVACQVRDINDLGAKVAITNATVLPDRLFLIIHRDHRAYRARVIWRKGCNAGLAFESSIDLTSALPPELRYLQRAWQNNDQLTWR